MPGTHSPAVNAGLTSTGKRDCCITLQKKSQRRANMRKNNFGLGLAIAMLGSILITCPTGAAGAPRLPNVVIILADALGFGDVGCYGATKVKTPNVDRLAAQGLRFTDGHCTSATCTPSRYALLTGQYPWRKAGTNVLPGDAALIIDPGRPTLPSVLKDAGYTAGVVGKWHL